MLSLSYHQLSGHGQTPGKNHLAGISEDLYVNYDVLEWEEEIGDKRQTIELSSGQGPILHGT